MSSRRSVLALVALGLAGCSGTPQGGSTSERTAPPYRPDDDTATTSERPETSTAKPHPPEGAAVQWRLDTGASVGAPVVHGGTVYAVGGTNDRGDPPAQIRNGPDQQSQNLVAVTPDGEVQWRYRASAPLGELTPADGGIYATAGWNTGLSGLETRVLRVSDGERAWASETVDSYLSIIDTGPDGVYVGTNDDSLGTSGEQLFALGHDGSRRWTVDAGDAFDGAVHDGRLYLSSAGGRMLRARDAATGGVVWTSSREPIGSLRAGDGVLYVDDGRREDGNYPLCSISASDGEDRWCFVSDAASDGPFVPTAVVRSGDTLVGAENDGLAFGVDPTDGTERWHYDIGGEPGDLVVRDGVAYVADESGAVHALDATSGERQWRVSAPGRPSDLSVTDAAVVVDLGGTAGGGVVAYDHEGTELWRFSHPRQTSPVAAVGDRAVLGTDSGYLVGLGP